MIEQVLAGTLLGVAGALPFVHVNLLLQIAGRWAGGGISAAAFATSASFSHLAFESLPSLLIFLPSEDLSASVLPMQRMALQGRSAEALRLWLEGILVGICLAALLLPLQSKLVAIAKDALGANSKFVLLAIVAAFIGSVRGWREKALSAFVFALSGAAGLAVFAWPDVGDALFPLLTGLFAVPAILLSSGKGPREGTETDCGGRLDLRLAALGVGAAAFSPIFPALSVSVLLCLCLLAYGEGADGFMSVAPALASAKTLFDITAGASLGKARSMAGVIAQGAIGNGGDPTLWLVTVSASALAAAALAACALLIFRKRLFRLVGSLEQSRARKIALGLALAAMLATGGLASLAVCALASLVGALPLLLGLRRSLCGGALIVPALAYAFRAMA